MNHFGPDLQIDTDVGGTSADIGVDGAPGLTDKGHIGNWPLASTMIDLTTIGAGGGSMARYSAGGTLTIGPQTPGPSRPPACLWVSVAAPGLF